MSLTLKCRGTLLEILFQQRFSRVAWVIWTSLSANPTSYLREKPAKPCSSVCCTPAPIVKGLHSISPARAIPSLSGNPISVLLRLLPASDLLHNSSSTTTRLAAGAPSSPIPKLTSVKPVLSRSQTTPPKCSTLLP